MRSVRAACPPNTGCSILRRLANLRRSPWHRGHGFIWHLSCHFLSAVSGKTGKSIRRLEYAPEFLKFRHRKNNAFLADSFKRAEASARFKMRQLLRA